jgi:hypothetical protein
MVIAAVASPSSYWFVTRGTGAIALVLLTASVALGILNVRRTRLPNVPRFVWDSLHRTASLLAVAFVLVHIATASLDGFAPISLLDLVIPFQSGYRPFWLGLGTCAFDLLVAVTITSLVRQRLGYRTWRSVHWLAYASWPVALVHGLGAGSDARTHWLLVLSAACVAVMLAAIVVRVASGWPAHLPARVSVLGAVVLALIGLILWLPSGPLASGWARRAGTPAYLLTAAHSTSAAPASGGRAAGSAAAGTGGVVSANLTGTIDQVSLPHGGALVDIRLTSSSDLLHALHIRIRGRAVDGGGVEMTSSRVALGPADNPDEYSGIVTALNGTNVDVRVTGPGGSAYAVLVQLAPQAGSAVTGSMTATP